MCFAVKTPNCCMNQAKNWAKEYDTLSVAEGITGLGEGYIEFFSHIDCLILNRSVESIVVSPELLKKMAQKKVMSLT